MHMLGHGELVADLFVETLFVWDFVFSFLFGEPLNFQLVYRIENGDHCKLGEAWGRVLELWACQLYIAGGSWTYALWWVFIVVVYIAQAGHLSHVRHLLGCPTKFSACHASMLGCDFYIFYFSLMEFLQAVICECWLFILLMWYTLVRLLHVTRVWGFGVLCFNNIIEYVCADLKTQHQFVTHTNQTLDILWVMLVGLDIWAIKNMRSLGTHNVRSRFTVHFDMCTLHKANQRHCPNTDPHGP